MNPTDLGLFVVVLWSVSLFVKELADKSFMTEFQGCGHGRCEEQVIVVTVK